MKLSLSVVREWLLFALGLGAGALTAHGQTLVDLRTQSKSVDFSAATATKPFQTGTALPASCGTGELFFLLGATAGKNTYGCTATNTWTLQSGGSGLPDGTSHANQVIGSDGTNSAWQTFGGDVTGGPLTMRVGGLQGRTLAATTPADGQVIRWSASANSWLPGQIAASPNYAATFTSMATVMIPGSQHNLGTANLLVNCYDTSTPAVLLQPAGVTVDPTTFNVTITFSTAKSGRCVVNGSGGSGLAPSAGGDLSGLLSAATVAGIQNRPVAATVPTDGQVLTYSLAAGQWQAQTPAAGSGGGGGQFNALTVSYGNASTLNVGTGCSTSAPCNVRFGNTVYSVVTSSTVTWQSGLGTAYLYMTSAGILTVGSNMVVTCSSGCTVIPNVAAFPPNVIPLYTWTTIPTGWNAAGGADMRSPLSTKIVAPGVGLVVIDSGLQSTIAVDAAAVPAYLTNSGSLTFTSTPAASCTGELTISVVGANPGDSVAPGWPPTLPANIMGMMRVNANDTVGVKLCNPTGAAIAVPADVFRATIVRSL